MRPSSGVFTWLRRTCHVGRGRVRGVPLGGGRRNLCHFGRGRRRGPPRVTRHSLRHFTLTLRTHARTRGGRTHAGETGRRAKGAARVVYGPAAANVPPARRR